MIDHEKLKLLLPDKCTLGLDLDSNADPEVQQTMQVVWKTLVSSSCSDLRRYLPEFIDRIIDAAVDNPIVIENFSQIVNPDRQPSGLNDVMSSDEFVRFKVYEITNYLNARLLEWFDDYRKEESDGID